MCNTSHSGIAAGLNCSNAILRSGQQYDHIESEPIPIDKVITGFGVKPTLNAKHLIVEPLPGVTRMDAHGVNMDAHDVNMNCSFGAKEAPGVNMPISFGAEQTPGVDRTTALSLFDDQHSGFYQQLKPTTSSIASFKMDWHSAEMPYHPPVPPHHPPEVLSGPSHHPPQVLSGPSHHPPQVLSGPSHRPPQVLSGPSHRPPQVLSGPSHHPPQIISGPSHHPPQIISGPSYCPPQIISGPSHHPPQVLSGPSHPPQIFSGPSHPPQIFSGPSHHPPQVLSGPSHPPQVFSGPSHHPPQVLSGPSHPPQVFSGPSHHTPQILSGPSQLPFCGPPPLLHSSNVQHPHFRSFDFPNTSVSHQNMEAHSHQLSSDHNTAMPTHQLSFSNPDASHMNVPNDRITSDHSTFFTGSHALRTPLRVPVKSLDLFDSLANDTGPARLMTHDRALALSCAQSPPLSAPKPMLLSSTTEPNNSRWKLSAQDLKSFHLKQLQQPMASAKATLLWDLQDAPQGKAIRQRETGGPGAHMADKVHHVPKAC